MLSRVTTLKKRGKRQVLIRPCSKVIVWFLTVMMKHGYIGEFEIIDDHRAGKIVVNLTGRLNKVRIDYFPHLRMILHGVDIALVKLNSGVVCLFYLVG